MSNRGNDDLFGLDDLENFGDPSFGDEEVEATPVRAGGSPRNTRFLLIAILLVIVILIGVVVIILAAINQGTINAERQATANAIETSNARVAFALTQTSIAASWTKTPTPTSTPTETPTPTVTPSPTDTPSITPSITVTYTPSIDVPGTMTAQFLTLEIEKLTLSPQDLTATAIANQQTLVAMTITALAGTAATPTPTIPEGIGTAEGTSEATEVATLPPTLPVNVTQVPGGPIVVIIASLPAVVVVTPTPVPSDTRTPRPTELSRTGFFDAAGGGGVASPSTLPIVGLAALGLVAVIFVSRMLRVKA